MTNPDTAALLSDGRTRILLQAAAASCLFIAGSAAATAQHFITPSSPPVVIASLTPGPLPEAPGSLFASSAAMASSPAASSSSSLDGALDAPSPGQRTSSPASARQPEASTTDKYIAPGQPVPTLTVGNKVALGIKDAISPLSFVGWAVTAGYEQGTNGSPNYGTNGRAFAQRFGAAAARASSEGIFSDSVMAPILHEDPRYYRMGPGNNFFKRLTYAGTRTLITRTDGGRRTPNFALLAGNLGGSYLTKAYYPPLNTSNTEVLKTFGGSVGGSALGFVVSEFLSGTLNIFHISKPAHD